MKRIAAGSLHYIRWLTSQHNVFDTIVGTCILPLVVHDAAETSRRQHHLLCGSTSALWFYAFAHGLQHLPHCPWPFRLQYCPLHIALWPRFDLHGVVAFSPTKEPVVWLNTIGSVLPQCSRVIFCRAQSVFHLHSWHPADCPQRPKNS